MKTKNLVLIGVLAVVGLLVLFGVLAAQSGNEAYRNDASPVMYFYRADCHFCQQQAPILRELAGEGFRVKVMDVGKYPNYWQEYSVGGTPMFLAQNGDRLEGLQQKEPLRQFLASHGAKIA